MSIDNIVTQHPVLSSCVFSYIIVGIIICGIVIGETLEPRYPESYDPFPWYKILQAILFALFISPSLCLYWGIKHILETIVKKISHQIMVQILKFTLRKEARKLKNK